MDGRKSIIFVLILCTLFYLLGSAIGTTGNPKLFLTSAGDRGNNNCTCLWNVSTDSNNLIYLNESYDRVGIGTDVPSYQLHIFNKMTNAWFEVQTDNSGSTAGCYFTRPDTNSKTSLFFQTESTPMWELGMRGGNNNFYFRNLFKDINIIKINSTVNTMWVNGELHANSFHGDGGNLTNVTASIPEKEYASFYLTTGGLTSIGSGEKTLKINATAKNSDTSIFYLSNNIVKVNKTADFLITGECYWNSGGSSRSEYTIWLEETGDIVSGTRSGIYARGYDSGSTGAFTTIYSVTSGDTFTIKIQRTNGSGSSGYQDDYGTRLTFVEL